MGPESCNGCDDDGSGVIDDGLNTCGPRLLDAVFRGQAQFVEDTAFKAPPEIYKHVETSTVVWQGRHLMFYRTFIEPNGTPTFDGRPRGIALAISQDGNTFVAHNGGRPVIPNGAGGLGTDSLYAPSVIAETINGVPQLTMAFEAQDPGVHPYVAMASSIDGGFTWTGFKKLIVAQQPWEGNDNGVVRGNVGTPSLTRLGNQYILFYHGWTGYNGVGAQTRGLATGTSLHNLSKHPANPVLRPQVGTWNEFTIGRGDLIREGDFWYTVYEGFSGSGGCDANGVAGWGLARSTDLVKWEHSAFNPIVLDREGNVCGNDMPAFQVFNTVETTGWRPSAAPCSGSATPPSMAPWPDSPSMRASPASSPRARARDTGSSAPMAASSPSATRGSGARRMGGPPPPSSGSSPASRASATTCWPVTAASSTWETRSSTAARW